MNLKEFLMQIKSILYAIILITLIFSSCKGDKIRIDKNKYSYDWGEMPFHNYSDKMLIDKLGKPNNDIIFNLNKDSTQVIVPMYFPLIRYVPINMKSINVRELSWKQEDFIIIYWLLKKENIWLAVDGVIYDPNHIEF